MEENSIGTGQDIVSELANMDFSKIAMSDVIGYIVQFGKNVILALVVYFIGRFIIKYAIKLLRKVTQKRQVEASLTSFLNSLISISLNLLLAIIIIGILGIDTSSFLAVFASAGIAVGMALSGTLQNFAGGVLILLLKPYKVGDYIEFGDLKGTVREIQIFNTVINTYNNDRIVIPNGGLATSSLKNFSAEPYHRVEWRVGITYGDDVEKARKIALDILAADGRIVHTDADVKEEEQPVVEETHEKEEEKMPWWKRLFHWHRRRTEELREEHEARLAALLPKPNYSPSVNVESLDESQVTLIVRAWTEIANYWDVLYSVNEQIYKQFPQHGLHFPFPQMDVHVRH